MDIMSMALRIQELEAENTRLHETMERPRVGHHQLQISNEMHYRERNSAFKLLARMWRSGSLPEDHIFEVIDLFAEAGFTNRDVEDIAEDSLGPMPHEMLEDSEEEEEV